jgi:hypothetical protein
MNDSHDDEDIKGSYILANKPETPEDNGDLPSLSEDCDRLRNLSDVGDTFGYGRTRFYQWCRGRGYMVTTLSENGYSRVYVTQDGFNYVGNAFRDDIQKRMVKI